MRFVFEREYDISETFDISRSDLPRDGTFEVGEMPMNMPRDPFAFGCKHDDEAAPIRLGDATCNQVAGNQAIEDASQCRSFMGQSTVEIGHFGR